MFSSGAPRPGRPLWLRFVVLAVGVTLLVIGIIKLIPTSGPAGAHEQPNLPASAIAVSSVAAASGPAGSEAAASTAAGSTPASSGPGEGSSSAAALPAASDSQGASGPAGPQTTAPVSPTSSAQPASTTPGASANGVLTTQTPAAVPTVSNFAATPTIPAAPLNTADAQAVEGRRIAGYVPAPGVINPRYSDLGIVGVFTAATVGDDTVLPLISADQSSILGGFQTGRRLPGRLATFQFVLLETTSNASADEILADLNSSIPRARTLSTGAAHNMFVTAGTTPQTMAINADGPTVSVITVDGQDAAAAATVQAGVAAQTAALRKFTPRTAGQISSGPADVDGMYAHLAVTTTSPQGGVYSPAADVQFEDNQPAAKQLLTSTGVDAVARGGDTDEGPALYRTANPVEAAALKNGLLTLVAAAAPTTTVLDYGATVPGAVCTANSYLCFFTQGCYVALVSSAYPAGVETALLAEKTAMRTLS